jgi:hypothetical protein
LDLSEKVNSSADKSKRTKGLQQPSPTTSTSSTESTDFNNTLGTFDNRRQGGALFTSRRLIDSFLNQNDSINKRQKLAFSLDLNLDQLIETQSTDLV